VQSQQLLAKSQILENKILAGAEKANDPADQVTEQSDHGPQSYRNPRLSPERKSFISRVREVLMSHTGFPLNANFGNVRDTGSGMRDRHRKKQKAVRKM